MNKQMTKVASDEILQQLNNSFPSDPSALKISLPRFGMQSQDVTEELKNPKTGKKEINIVTEAGTFFVDHPTDEIDPETKKKVWEHQEIGKEAEVIIMYQRKQLRFYDSGSGYVSSPIYDTDDEIIPLFKDKKQIKKGTPAELRALPEYQGKTAAGEPISKLEIDRVLYIRYENETYQMTLRGTSMYAFLAYMRQTKPSNFITQLGSEPKENGTTKWNQTTFTAVRKLNQDEAETVLEEVTKITTAIAMEKASYAAKAGSGDAKDKELDEMAEEAGASLDAPARIAAPRKR